MSSKVEKRDNAKNKMSFFDYATEVVGWLQIVASRMLGGLVIAAMIYFPDPTTLRLVIAIGVLLLGLIVGIIFATRIWKKQGTIHFVSGVMATPELDNLEEEMDAQKKSTNSKASSSSSGLTTQLSISQVLFL